MKTSNFFNYPHNLELPLFGKSDFKEFKIIDFKDLYTNQPEIDEKVLANKIRGVNLTLPYVVEFKGKRILIDGHHTIVAKILNGQKKVRVMYLKF